MISRAKEVPGRRPDCYLFACTFSGPDLQLVGPLQECGVVDILFQDLKLPLGGRGLAAQFANELVQLAASIEIQEQITSQPINDLSATGRLT